MRLLEAFVRSAAYERRFLLQNRWDLAMVLWIPLLTVLLVWWIFSQTQITDLPIGVIAEEDGPVTSTLVRYLDAHPNINIAGFYANSRDAEAAILQRDIYAVVIIPDNFSTNIFSGKPSPVVLQVNAQYGTHSGIIQNSVQAVTATLSAGVEIQRLIKQGVAPSQAAIDYSPISIQRISLFNAATNYQQFLASTVIPALLHILAMVIGATTIGRELRDKQLDKWYGFINGNQSDYRLLQDPPINPSADELPPTKSSVSVAVLLVALIGKYFWPMLAFILWSALGVGLASYQQNIDLQSLMAVFLGLILLMILSFWLGAIFTLIPLSLRMGLSTTGFISAPSYAFAGVTFPYIAISDKAKYWADALPLTHYLKLHIAQLQMQAPLALSSPIIYGLMLATIIAALLSALLTKRALAHPERWGAR
ncbi:ABC transporter permease [Psychrobacter sp. AH5]|uniref:ABC transporter permease n=1 Tax=Psychrobacter sp. AH5 TaxID=2937433 RepID=UPI00333FBF05